MDNRQPSSGDLKELKRLHNLDSQSSSSSSTSSSTPSLLERRQSTRSQGIDEEPLISPMPTGAERMAALRDLGATFEEGQKSIAKVATPTETIVPSFVDSNHLEQILRQKHRSKLGDNKSLNSNPNFTHIL